MLVQDETDVSNAYWKVTEKYDFAQDISNDGEEIMGMSEILKLILLKFRNLRILLPLRFYGNQIWHRNFIFEKISHLKVLKFPKLLDSKLLKRSKWEFLRPQSYQIWFHIKSKWQKNL